MDVVGGLGSSESLDACINRSQLEQQVIASTEHTSFLLSQTLLLPGSSASLTVSTLKYIRNPLLLADSAIVSFASALTSQCVFYFGSGYATSKGSCDFSNE